MGTGTDPTAAGTADEEAAVGALERLGLTSYEAGVFVALQRLGIASASEIDRVAEVPRSQVYGAAENLQDRGLVERQQSDPIRYRAVDPAEAQERLRARYERRESRAFDCLESVAANRQEPAERQEDVWMVEGRENVADRTGQLVREAEDCLLYGAGPERLEANVVDAFHERAESGVSVTVVSGADEVLDRFADDERVAAIRGESPEGSRAGRILVVDGESLLVSVRPATDAPDRDAETAIWSAETGFADVLVRMMEPRLDEFLSG